VLKPKGNSPLGTRKHRCDRRVKMDVSQVVPMSMDKLVLT